MCLGGIVAGFEWLITFRLARILIPISRGQFKLNELLMLLDSENRNKRPRLLLLILLKDIWAKMDGRTVVTMLTILISKRRNRIFTLIFFSLHLVDIHPTGCLFSLPSTASTVRLLIILIDLCSQKEHPHLENKSLSSSSWPFVSFPLDAFNWVQARNANRTGQSRAEPLQWNVTSISSGK